MLVTITFLAFILKKNGIFVYFNMLLKKGCLFDFCLNV